MISSFMDVNNIGSWIYYNQPVTISNLVKYTKTPDRKAKGLLLYLTYRIPIHEDDRSRLGLDPDLPGFKSFHLLEQREL